MIDKVQYWKNLANEDLSAAEDMHKTKHWLYVGFMCHQAIEKIEKAYWCAKKPDIDTPYTHNIHLLAESSGLSAEMTTAQLHFLHIMLPLNIEARYPDYKSSVAASLNEARCFDILTTTKNLVAWIESMC